MVLAGAPFAHEIAFDTGSPVGAITYSLYGNDGNVMSGYNGLTVTPDIGAMSVLVVIPGAANTVATPLFEQRTLLWSYMTAGGMFANQITYKVQKQLPFPATPDGVRAKLGLGPQELSDNSIDLMMAYANLVYAYEDNAFDPYATTGDRNTLLVTNAIEAMAALAAIPTLQLGIAKKESSGTNSYERFPNMDWDALIAALHRYLDDLNGLVTPLVDPYGASLIFFTVSPTLDFITNQAPV
jgi:hypothetical protein